MQICFCLCVCACVSLNVCWEAGILLFPKDSRPVSVWQLGGYSHLQTNFPSATGLRSAKPRVQLKLVRLRDTTKWNVSLGVFLTMVHFDPLQCLYEIFPFYMLHTSIIIFFFFFVSLNVSVSLQESCCTTLAQIALLHGGVGIEIQGSLVTGAKAGCFTLQLAVFWEAVLGSQECMAM